MYGPDLLARFLTRPGPADKYGNCWQYHSRSDRHSKVGCWGIALDLLATSSLLRRHVEDRKVVVGVNHKMTDFATGRHKRLDLVIARPDSSVAWTSKRKTFASLAAQYDIELTSEEQGVLDALPTMYVADVAAVLVALEAKACMTAHVKALPRLYDELNSSHLCVHGASRQALAIGYAQINCGPEFISPIMNNFSIDNTRPVVSIHNQPHDTIRVLEKISEIPRRSTSSEVGFDGLGVTVLDIRNNGSRVRLVESFPAPQPGGQFHYASMITRMANEYDTIFKSI